MAFWFDTNGVSFAFRAGQPADYVFKPPRTEGEGDNFRTLSFASCIWRIDTRADITGKSRREREMLSLFSFFNGPDHKCSVYRKRKCEQTAKSNDWSGKGMVGSSAAT